MNLTVNEFCESILDGMYNPNLPDSEQCSGYKLLKELIVSGFEPFDEEETLRWKERPTTTELLSSPDPRYLQFLHPLTRNLVRKKWETIKKLKI